MSENYIEIIKQDKLFPIIRTKESEEAIEISKALVEGGIRILEINVENPTLYKAIAEISKFATVCAGGIITSMQADAAFECGAKMIASPIFQLNMVKITKNKRVPFIAGASTANEAYIAWKSRIPLIKLYPADAMGGVQYIEDILRQMPFLKVMPMGNIKYDEIQSYLDAGATVVGIGRDLCECENLSDITLRTKHILEELKK